MIDRRTADGYRLRIYLALIEEVKAISKEEWVNQWVKTSVGPFIPKDTWVAYLEQCALAEMQKYFKDQAA